MTAVHKEIMSRYRVDGIFMNRWDGSGDCYCEHCRTNFKAASGFDLPRSTDPQDFGATSLLPLATAAAHGSCRCVEHRDPRHQSGVERCPQQRRWSAQLTRHAGNKPSHTIAGRRPAGTAWTRCAMADGQDRQRVSVHNARETWLSGCSALASKSRIGRKDSVSSSAGNPHLEYSMPSCQ